MNIYNELKKLDQYFSPRILGIVNDQYIKIAKIKGDDIPWHDHEKEDELFYIISGSLHMEIEGQDSFTMGPGDLYIVKKGIKHRVSAVDECSIMLIESKTTEHTGKVQSPITKTIKQQQNG